MQRIGIVGTGFIGQGLARAVSRCADLALGPVLTRRPLETCSHLAGSEQLTQSLDELIERSDLIAECSGHVVHATRVVDAALRARLPVVTMNAEMHVTTGSFLVGRGKLSEAEGDQPGSLAALAANAIAMGCRPIVYGNAKGYLDEDPSPAQVAHWADRQGISPQQVTSFTDGTKVQIEQALVANGLGAEIVRPGLLGPRVEHREAGAATLLEAALARGVPISDYILSPSNSGELFLVAEHDTAEQAALRYFKLGNGPHYLLRQPFHLCHLEMPKTIRRVLAGEQPLLDNSPTPRVGVYARAKRRLEPGTTLPFGIGSFAVRGCARPIRESTALVPIGLLYDARIVGEVGPGELIPWEAVELPESLAVEKVRRDPSSSFGADMRASDLG